MSRVVQSYFVMRWWQINSTNKIKKKNSGKRWATPNKNWEEHQSISIIHKTTNQIMRKGVV